VADDRRVADDCGVTQNWMLDEVAHAGPEHLDAGFIAVFDRKQGYPDPTADIAVFESHGLDDTSTIIDLGAGTGQFALPAARRFGRVIAVDVSPAMLAALRAKANAPLPSSRTAEDEAGPPRLQCVRGGFLSFSPAEPADGVYTRNALHQLPDFWKAVALRKIADMLRPGGVLRLLDLVYDFAPDEADTVFGDWFAAAETDPANGYTAADYAEHIRTEHSTFRWLLEPMLAAAGFEVAEVSYVRRVYAAYTCVKTAKTPAAT
jgi:SAM-dependent methyltransferase